MFDWMVRDRRNLILSLSVFFGLVTLMIVFITMFAPGPSDRQEKCGNMNYFTIKGQLFCYNVEVDGSIERLFPR